MISYKGMGNMHLAFARRVRGSTLGVLLSICISRGLNCWAHLLSFTYQFVWTGAEWSHGLPGAHQQWRLCALSQERPARNSEGPKPFGIDSVCLRHTLNISMLSRNSAFLWSRIPGFHRHSEDIGGAWLCAAMGVQAVKMLLHVCRLNVCNLLLYLWTRQWEWFCTVWTCTAMQ